MGCGNSMSVRNDYERVESSTVQKGKIKSKYSIVPKILKSGKVYLPKII